MMSLEALTEISRCYGGNPEYVLAGGGNTSWKDEETLYVKSSGTSLADAVPDSFVRMDRRALALIWEKLYPQSNEERESAVLADMIAARKSGEGQKRPSVEALLHSLLPFSFVVHLHPALVNGICCSRQGEAAVREIFGETVLWIPSTNPGYVLSKTVKTAMDECGSNVPAVIFMQNHGVFAGAESTDAVKALYDGMMRKIGERIQRHPDFADSAPRTEGTVRFCENKLRIMQVLKELAGASAFMSGGEIDSLVKNRDSFTPVSSAFTPDHIVYSGSDPLFAETDTDEGIRAAWNEHTRKTGMKPKIAAVQGMGIFSAATSEKAAHLALDLFKDTIKVSVYSESFGGQLFMAQDKIDFINNWEVERFRVSVSTK